MFSEKLQKFSGMVTRQVMESLSGVACRGGDEPTEVTSCRDEAAAFRLKMAAIGIILVGGVLGVTIPLIGTKRRFVRTDSTVFAFFKAFAAGVILATGFVHMLPDGQAALNDPCLPKSPWSDFPFSGFVAMMAALSTLLMDFLATQYYERKHSIQHAAAASAAAAANPSSSALSTEDDGRIGIVIDEPHDLLQELLKEKPNDDASCSEESKHHHHHHEHHHHHSARVRHIVVSQILELGIVSHSIIIGLSLGVSHNSCTIRPLIAALSFHQFFEGFALGGCISQAQFENLAAALMASFFALTTPAGIATGAAAASFYDPNSPRALVVEGVFDCVSAGILIYMALVDLIATDFIGHHATFNARHHLVSFLALFLGAGAMSLLALWA